MLVMSTSLSIDLAAQTLKLTRLYLTTLIMLYEFISTSTSVHVVPQYHERTLAS